MFENQGVLTAVKSAVITITTRKAPGAFNLIVGVHYVVPREKSFPHPRLKKSVTS